MGEFGDREGHHQIYIASSRAALERESGICTCAEWGQTLPLFEPPFSHLRQILRPRQPQDTLDPEPGKLPSPHAPKFLHGLLSACPLLLLSFCGLEEQLWEQRAGSRGESNTEGLRGPCSRLVTAHMGPLGAECSYRNRVTQMLQPPPSVCQGRPIPVPRHRRESACAPLRGPQTSSMDPHNWMHCSLSCSGSFHGSAGDFRGRIWLLVAIVLATEAQL